MNEPKLRFKADDGSEFPDWEEKKLGDFGVATGGTSIESEFSGACHSSSQTFLSVDSVTFRSRGGLRTASVIAFDWERFVVYSAENTSFSGS